MKKTIILAVGLFLLISQATLADEDHGGEIAEGKPLVESEVSCDQLSEHQLEAIGEYFMGLMHPGEEHEVMDEMMGGEGSESLRQAHIRIARMRYCGMGGGIMGSGMMGGIGRGSAMMGGYTPSTWSMIWVVVWALPTIALILAAAWLYRKSKGDKDTESPDEILKKRYAKGEISRKEFKQMKKELN